MRREDAKMTPEWIACVDKKPCNRTLKDVDIIFSHLRQFKTLEKVHPVLLQQLACCGYYEDLEKGVTLFRQGNRGTSWYAVLTGSLDVLVSRTGKDEDASSLCSLGIGATFGESILDDTPREATVVTKDNCELLRVEQRDFRLLWEKNKELMEDLLGHSSHARNVSQGNSRRPSFSPESQKAPSPSVTTNHVVRGASAASASLSASPSPSPASPAKRVSICNTAGAPNPALPVTESPSEEVVRAGWVLYTLIRARAPGLVRDRKVQGRLLRRCLVGSELVDWLMELSGVIRTRPQAVALWQALLEEGVLTHVTEEHPFRDKYLFYRFREEDEGGVSLPQEDEIREAEDSLKDVLAVLTQRAPDAMMRMVLRKPSHERTADDLEMIYEELLHIKALSHLSNSIKRELANVIVFESHPHSGAVLFHQGDEGKSWYIILKGSVNVVIHGKGTVTSLHEGDDFGKLALINDAPRAATIVLREDNCHFLRVDKEDFNRILRDVEANTVRLKEHGQDVLVLEKISSSNAVPYSHFKYTVMAGSPQKMLEHLLETRLDGRELPGREDAFRLSQPGLVAPDYFLDDFLLTHIIFMPVNQLVTELTRHYRIESPSQDLEFLLACKRRVVQFVHRWVMTIRDPVFEEQVTHSFLEELYNEVKSESAKYSPLREETALLNHVMDLRQKHLDEKQSSAGQTWKLPPGGQPITLFTPNISQDEDCFERRNPMRTTDDIIFRVYCADHTYCTLRFPLTTTAETVKHSAADKLGLKRDDLLLVELKSSGEKVVFKDGEVSIPTALTLNGRVFLSPKDHLDALTCLSDQERPPYDEGIDLEIFSTKELAYHLTILDWTFFCCVHEYELIYHTFGRHHFRKITSNLDVFLRRFNEMQYWIVTEICRTAHLSKRVQLLRKFIKLAAYCKEYQNLNAFFAVVMGLSNVAITRLAQTWEKLPSKFRKMFSEYETLIDPSRNHRAYRIAFGKLHPPIIPFMPLLLKDMTFTHEGNKTLLDGLVNFEKMHMLAQTMRTLRYCRTRQLMLPPPTPKNEPEIRSYIRSLRVIDSQRILNQMAQKLEPRRS